MVIFELVIFIQSSSNIIISTFPTFAMTFRSHFCRPQSRAHRFKDCLFPARKNLLLFYAALCLHLLLLTPVPHNAEPSSSSSANGSTAINSNNKLQMARSDPTASSSATYYTNDLSSFLSNANTAKSPSNPTSSSVPYQALLQAISQANVPSASQPSSASSWMTQPSTSSWSSMMMSGPSSFMSMLRPMSSQPPVGGRRSSLTSRLRNIMNSLFYRESNNSPMMSSASSYSYSYRPAPYGFGATNTVPGFPTREMTDYSSLYGSNNYMSGLYADRGKPSMYGAASNYRPSYVAMPSASSNPFMRSPAPWSSPPMKGVYGRNYGVMPSVANRPPYQQYGSQYIPPQQPYSQQYPVDTSSSYRSPPQTPYATSMSESSPSMAYNGQNSNQWSSPMNDQRPSSMQSPVNNLDRPFIGPNQAVWSQPNSNTNMQSPQQTSQWSTNESSQNDAYGDGSRDEGASYYASNVFQSRISAPSHNSAKVTSSPTSVMPTYVAPKFAK